MGTGTLFSTGANRSWRGLRKVNRYCSVSGRRSETEVFLTGNTDKPKNNSWQIEIIRQERTGREQYKVDLVYSPMDINIIKVLIARKTPFSPSKRKQTFFLAHFAVTYILAWLSSPLAEVAKASIVSRASS